MAEDKKIDLAEKIEKLILDGQNKVLESISQLHDGQTEILKRVSSLEGGQKRLEDGQKTIIDWVKKIDKKHDINADANYDLLQDVKKDIKRVEDKLDEHMRKPAHAGM